MQGELIDRLSIWAHQTDCGTKKTFRREPSQLFRGCVQLTFSRLPVFHPDLCLANQKSFENTCCERFLLCCPLMKIAVSTCESEGRCSGLSLFQDELSPLHKDSSDTRASFLNHLRMCEWTYHCLQGLQVPSEFLKKVASSFASTHRSKSVKGYGPFASFHSHLSCEG